MRKAKSHKRYQAVIMLTVILLCGIGIIMVYSASSYQCSISAKYDYEGTYYLKRQVIYVIVGLVCCMLLQFVHYNLLYRCAKVVYCISLLSISLLLTSLGVSVNGATRWIRFSGIQFQVAEVVKIDVIIFLSYMVQRYYKYLRNWRLVLYMWLAGGTAAALLMKISNDLSSSIVMLGITFGITFIFTDTTKMHVATAGTVVLGIGLYIFYIFNHLPAPGEIHEISFRAGRIAAWLRPELYESDISYQSLQALYAIGRGGIIGCGLGGSIQKLGVLPEAQNDMIFAVLCEELGVFGAVLVFGLYIYLFWGMMHVAMNAPDVFGAGLVTGSLIHIACQMLINISVNLGVIPNTGIGLPFISYGGTAVFCQLIEMALVFSVERASKGYRQVIIGEYM